MAQSRKDSRQPTPVREESDDQNGTSLPPQNIIAIIVHPNLQQIQSQTLLPSITRTRKVGSKPGRYRRQFTKREREETKASRKAKVCAECKRKKSRCHESHRRPPVESPVQASALGRQPDAVPRPPTHSWSVDEYLTNPADARPLIESFRPIPNSPDIKLDPFDTGTSVSYGGVSTLPAYRIQKSTATHSTHRLGNNVHAYPRSDPPGHELFSRRPEVRMNGPQERARNSNKSNRQQSRPERRELGDNHQLINQTLQPPTAARAARRSLPAGSTAHAQNTRSDLVSHNAFRHEPSPPPHDPLYDPYSVQFNHMEGGSMNANLPSMNDVYPSNPTPSPRGFIPPGYNLTPFTPPSSQGQGHYQDHEAGPMANNQRIMENNSNAVMQNAMVPNAYPLQQIFNQAQPFVPDFDLPSQHEADFSDLQSYLPSQEDIDMMNDMMNDTIDKDLSDPAMIALLNDPPPATHTMYDDNVTNFNNYDTNNANNANNTNNMNGFHPNTTPSNTWHNESFNDQISPVLELANWNFAQQTDFSNEQPPFHDPTSMTYDDTYFPSFGNSETSSQFEGRPSLPF